MSWDILLIFFVLSVMVPLRGRARLQQLLAKPRVERAERLSLYASTIAFQWLAAAVAAWRAWRTDSPPHRSAWQCQGASGSC